MSLNLNRPRWITAWGGVSPLIGQDNNQDER